MALTTWKCTKCGFIATDPTNVPQCPAASNQYVPNDPNIIGQTQQTGQDQFAGHSFVPVAMDN